VAGELEVTSGKRLQFMGWAIEQLGKPYIWDAKGPDSFDCSGFVTAGFYACFLPDWRGTHNSLRLYEELPPADDATVKPGDLCFWGSPDGSVAVDHVMVWWGDHAKRVLGACGGGSHTRTVLEALKHNAKVQFRPGINYRPYFRGYRKSPLDPPAEEVSTLEEVA
jgi:cell wall-associated NlpC family hydrolase